MVIENSPTPKMEDSVRSPFDPIWMGLKGCEVVVHSQKSLDAFFLDCDVMKLLAEMSGTENVRPLVDDAIIKNGWRNGQKPAGF